MSALILPRRFSQQPQGAAEIDRSNPLTAGIVDAIDCSNPIPRSIILRTPATPFGTTPASTATIKGKVIDTSAAYGGWYFQRSDGLYAQAAQSHVSVLRIIEGSGIYAGLFAAANGAGNAGSISLQLSVGTSFECWNFSANQTAFQSGVLSAQEWHVVGISAPASGNSITYKNGVVQESGLTVNPTAQTTSRLVLFGERTASAGYSFKGQMALHVVYNRALSAAEHRALADNPWQIFKPRRQVLYFGGSGSGITIACTPGNTTAAGVTAAVSQAITLPATVGNAVAAGTTASVSQAITLSATVGNATAAGTTASVTQAITINTTVGNAVAAGITAGISLAGSITINCTVGGATAAGVAANVAQGLILGCQVGNAVANGVAADVAITVTVTCTPGNATADGTQATIYAGETVTCTVGAATAEGIPASITVTGTLTDSQKIDLILDILQNKQVLDPASGMFTLYADDGTTVIYTAAAWEDAAGTVPYSGGCVRRLDAMI